MAFVIAGSFHSDIHERYNHGEYNFTEKNFIVNKTVFQVS